MGHGCDREAVDAFEIGGVARVNGEVVRQRDCGDHCVVAPGGDLAAAPLQRGCDLTKGSRRLPSKGKGSKSVSAC